MKIDINTQNRFEIAQKLVTAAVHLDWLKDIAPTSDKLRAEISESVEFLLKLTGQISGQVTGEHAVEVYKQVEPTPAEILFLSQLLNAAGYGTACLITEDLCSDTTTLH